MAPTPWLRYVLSLSTLIAAACGVRHQTATEAASTTKDIGTDLPDDGGHGAIWLYWTTRGRIYRAKCDGREDVIRLNCTEQMTSREYDRFKTELDGGLSDTIRELTEEARRIQSAISLIEEQISRTQAEIERLEQQIGPVTAEIERLRADMRRFEGFVREYREQLRLIEEALEHAADQDIAAMREIVMARLEDYRVRLGEIDRGIQQLLEQISGVTTEIASLRRELANLTTRLENLKVEMVDVSGRLQRAYDDFAVYEETLRRLTDGIIYQVLSDNVILQRQRQFIRRFDRIFDAQ